ncbi:efflux RND transporter permease subunit [Bradyrhizobium sp.]|uniref:efflux RND transporter permease subunit n=1 Tax=Bradyrhizobium sp. TaxID=376 RepID=UPI00345D525C
MACDIGPRRFVLRRNSSRLSSIHVGRFEPRRGRCSVLAKLDSPDEFGAIILRANADGSTARLRDVARIEIGGMSYLFNTRLNGKPTAGLSVLLSPTGNALATARAVESKMKELAASSWPCASAPSS